MINITDLKVCPTDHKVENMHFKRMEKFEDISIENFAFFQY